MLQKVIKLILSTSGPIIGDGAEEQLPWSPSASRSRRYLTRSFVIVLIERPLMAKVTHWYIRTYCLTHTHTHTYTLLTPERKIASGLRRVPADKWGLMVPLPPSLWLMVPYQAPASDHSWTCGSWVRAGEITTCWSCSLPRHISHALHGGGCGRASMLTCVCVLVVRKLWTGRLCSVGGEHANRCFGSEWEVTKHDENKGRHWNMTGAGVVLQQSQRVLHHWVLWTIKIKLQLKSHTPLTRLQRPAGGFH